MNKSERDELRRLLRTQFKILKGDVEARKEELLAELKEDIDRRFKAMDVAYDAAMYRVTLAVDEANRVANDVGRELWGLTEWGEKNDKRLIAQTTAVPNPSTRQRRHAMYEGVNEIDRRVRVALRELDRQEAALLTELATDALESTQAKAFFARIPIVSELVPAYRLAEIQP